MENSKKTVEVNTSSTFKVTTLFGQSIGGISLFLGFVFFLLGLAGSLDLIIESTNIKAKMLNASPGVVFIIVGLFILWRYKPKGSNSVTEERIVHKYSEAQKNQNAEKASELNIESEKTKMESAKINATEKEKTNIHKKPTHSSRIIKEDIISNAEKAFEIMSKPYRFDKIIRSDAIREYIVLYVRLTTDEKTALDAWLTLNRTKC